MRCSVQVAAYAGGMRPDLAPTACLPFEPEEARSLQWLPLAVRYKLDACGLRLSLGQWQALSEAARLQLLQLAAGAEFALRATQAGASREELGDVLAMAIQMGGGPGLMYAGHALACWDELASKAA